MALSFSQQAQARYRIIQPFLERDVPLTVLSRQHGISERTLRRWVARYREHGLAGLERRTRSDDGQRRKISDEMAELIRSYGLQKPRLPITAIHRKVAAHAQAASLPPPSYAVVYDVIAGIEPALMTLAHEGSRAYREQYDLIYRHESSEPNEMWQSDHTPLDILLLDASGGEKRPWLTTIIDDYSRAICGYFLAFDAPSAVHTALALRQGIWRKADPRWPVCGIPQILYVDNGSDFTTLAAFVGEQVEICYDPRDLAEIHVYHQGHFVCRAICQDIADQQLSFADIRKAREQRKRTLQRVLTSAKTTLTPETEEEAPTEPVTRSAFKLYRDE